MLSFLKEQSNKEPSTDEQGNKDSVKIAGQSEEQEYIEVSNNKERVRKSTGFLLVLVGIGLVFLFFMIKKSTPSEASATSVDEEELKIEKAISELTGVKLEMHNDMDAIVKKFYEFSNIEQVGVAELAKNPFRHKMFLVGLDSVKDSGEKGQAEIIYHQLKQQAEDMELLSIMRSSGQRCCMIDDTILRQGDSVGSFIVKEIGDDFVKLFWFPGENQTSSETEIESLEIILSLSD